MTYKELEALVLALQPDELGRLARAVANKLGWEMSYASGARTGYQIGERPAVRYTSEQGESAMDAHVQLLLERLAYLPPERQAEVGNFIEFLLQREATQPISKDFTRMSEAAFAKVWENDDDAAYDKL